MTIEPTESQAAPSDSSPIDEALVGLGSLPELPVADHPAVFEAIHRVLRDQLASSPDVKS